VVFAPRGFAIDQPLARIEKDLTNASTDLAASTILANICTDAFRKATGAQIALTANGLMRNGLTGAIQACKQSMTSLPSPRRGQVCSI
jgi:5'-nucleotidase / UDP-sugar diphosphatase